MDERRYYGLDALRGCMMLLGIVLHGAVLYVAAPPPTMLPLSDRNTSYVFDILVAFIHDFRMPVFFLLSGFFTALLVEKRGLAGTYRNRAARVLAPLLVAMVTILPLTGLMMVDCMVAARFGVHTLLPERSQLHILGAELAAKHLDADSPSLAHLWFLYYLLYFYLLIPVCRWLVQFSLRVEQGVRRCLANPATVLVFGLYTAATLWPFRGGEMYEGFIFVKPHPPSLIYYGSFFVLGYVLHSYREVLQSFSRHLGWYALLGAILFPLSFYASHLEYTAPIPGSHLAAVVLHGLCTWALVLSFLGCAVRYFDYESPWILYASQSSYWVFLLHMPAAGLASWWLMPYDLPAELKYLMVVSFTSVVCFTTYQYWVQATWLGAFLNGRRFDLDWPWRQRSPRALET